MDGTPTGTRYEPALVRYQPDGSLDAGFGAGGLVLAGQIGPDQSYVSGVVIQGDGRIVAAGPDGGDLWLFRVEGDDLTPPETTITAGPAGRTSDSTPTFEFTSSEAGSTFECQVDSGPYVGCTSPYTTSPLAKGTHTFRVRATDAAGNQDATPAERTFKICRSSLKLLCLP